MDKEQIKRLKSLSPIVSVARELDLKLNSSLLGQCPTGHSSESGTCFSLKPAPNHVDDYCHCFNCGKAWDAYELVRLVLGCDFKSAATWLAERFAPDLISEIGSQSVSRRPTSLAKVAKVDEPVRLNSLAIPPQRWIEKSIRLQAAAAKNLFSPVGLKMLAYLKDRGINEDSAKNLGLGFNPSTEYRPREDWGLEPKLKNDGRLTKLCIPAGLVIPVYRHMEGQRYIVHFKIRRDEATGSYKKYWEVNPPGQIGSMLLQGDGNLPTIIVESELDAVLIHQEAGDLVHCVALGGVKHHPDKETFSLIQRAPIALIAFDSDSAGAPAAWTGWVATLPNRYRLVMPTKSDGGRFKDPTEYHQAGGNLRTWVKVGLKLAAKKLNPAKPEVNQATNTPEAAIDGSEKANPGPEEAEPQPEPVTPGDVVHEFPGAKIIDQGVRTPRTMPGPAAAVDIQPELSCGSCSYLLWHQKQEMNVCFRPARFGHHTDRFIPDPYARPRCNHFDRVPAGQNRPDFQWRPEPVNSNIGGET
ncbi:MAG: hypothetical protein HQK57_02770 [Deltaproteobacteria bacterium]|nr:hypothetical protein [Deltaproteobacteria bacterium]